MAGLAEGVMWLLDVGVTSLHARLGSLKQRLWDGLDAIPGVRVRSPRAPDGVPIVTVTAERIDPATLADRLDREFGVLTRYGLHCAPDAHRILGTQDSGAVRFSLGWCSTERDVEQAIHAMERIAESGRFLAATPVPAPELAEEPLP
jgi:selenocysteine lyase/cysteine desulfurase